MGEEENGEGCPEEFRKGSPTDGEDGEAPDGGTEEETLSELLSEVVLIEREDWEVAEAIEKMSE